MTTMGHTGTTSGTAMPSAMNPAHDSPRHSLRLSETKSAFKTTELLAYLGTLAAIIVTAVMVDGDGGEDYFRADKALTMVVATTIGYLVARGLAKAGSGRHTADR